MWKVVALSNINLEVQRSAHIGPLVHKYGVAVWRQLVPHVVTNEVVDTIAKNIGNPSAYISTKGGSMTSNILSPELRRARVNPAMADGLASILSASGYIHDDGSSHSGIYVTHSTFKFTHPWHQDAESALSDYCACVWVACTPCGKHAPGIAFALNNPGRRIDTSVDEMVNSSPIFAPALEPGDAVFFDCYSLHATYRRQGMTLDRVAYKLTASRSPRLL